MFYFIALKWTILQKSFTISYFKHFSSTHWQTKNKLERISLAKLFLPSLTFAGRGSVLNTVPGSNVIKLYNRNLQIFVIGSGGPAFPNPFTA